MTSFKKTKSFQIGNALSGYFNSCDGCRTYHVLKAGSFRYIICPCREDKYVGNGRRHRATEKGEARSWFWRLSGGKRELRGDTATLAGHGGEDTGGVGMPELVTSRLSAPWRRRWKNKTIGGYRMLTLMTFFKCVFYMYIETQINTYIHMCVFLFFWRKLEMRWQIEKRGDGDSVKRKRRTSISWNLLKNVGLLENRGSKKQFMCS